MQVRILQRLIATNANAITTAHYYVTEYQSLGRYWKGTGDRETAGYYYDLADAQRNELKKLVENQRELKRELSDTIQNEREYRGIEEFVHALKAM